MTVDWEEINAKLPTARNEEEFAMRKDMWNAIDVNENGYLSLAELQRGIRDVLQCDDLFNCIPAINRAFFYCKNVNGEGDHGADYIDFKEFRLLLQSMRQIFEYYQAFDLLDTEEDRRISKEEFTADGVKESVEKWVGEIEDMEAEFDSIDTNGGGQILFNEFVDWALAKNLDVEDDIEPEAE